MNDIRKQYPQILNLSYERQFHLPLSKILRLLIGLTAIVFLFAGSVSAPTYNSPDKILAAQDVAAEQERKELENQLQELEQQIAAYENNATQYKKQGATLQNEIKKLESEIAKLNLQIKAINVNLKKLGGEIAGTQTEIDSVEKDIDFNKNALAQMLQELYENGDKNLAVIFLAHPTLSDFFNNLNNLMLVQENLRTVLVKMDLLKTELTEKKEQLAIKRMDAETLKTYRSSQKNDIQTTQTQKNSILKITKGKESEYKKLVQETQKSAAEIRKQIFKLLGGGELSFEQAYQLAKYAEQATGVRAALLLAILDRESALGVNVGKCDYKTAMHPTRDIPIFLKIVKSLDLEKNLEAGIIKVSCANSDGVYGGAMGPAQFIPSTWILYNNKVSQITGNNPTSPWRNEDAFVATAVYIKDLLNACSNYNGLSQERCAAARYYAGGRWTKYLATYGARVISQAQAFQKDIEILTS